MGSLEKKSSSEHIHHIREFELEEVEIKAATMGFNRVVIVFVILFFQSVYTTKVVIQNVTVSTNTSAPGNLTNVTIPELQSSAQSGFFAGLQYRLPTGIGRYKYHGDPKSWYDALAHCEREKSELAIINSPIEAEILQSFLDGDSRTNVTAAFIGIHDLWSEGHFVTIFGDSIESTGFSKWQKGEPNNGGGNEDCGVLTREAHLSDANCNHRLPFFCERNIC